MRIWRTVAVVIGGVICAFGQFVYDIFFPNGVSLPRVDVFSSLPWVLGLTVAAACIWLLYEGAKAPALKEKGEYDGMYWRLLSRRIGRS